MHKGIQVHRVIKDKKDKMVKMELKAIQVLKGIQVLKD